jgi:hypothetical protein
MSVRKKKTKKEGDGEVIKEELTLQALILADSFDEKFVPITLETPRVSLLIK